MAGIAVKFSISVELIKRVNRMYLNAMDIQAGQILKVPSNAVLKTAPNSTNVETKQTSKHASNKANNNTVIDFFKSIDTGIKSSKTRLEKFDSKFLDRLETQNGEDSSYEKI